MSVVSDWWKSRECWCAVVDRGLMMACSAEEEGLKRKMSVGQDTPWV